MTLVYQICVKMYSYYWMVYFHEGYSFSKSLWFDKEVYGVCKFSLRRCSETSNVFAGAAIHIFWKFHTEKSSRWGLTSKVVGGVVCVGGG